MTTSVNDAPPAFARGSIAARWVTLAPYFHAVLRIVTALVFMTAGTSKLFAFPVGMPPNNTTATMFTQVWVAGVLEVVGGALIALGLFTRPVAFLLAGEMAVAYFQVHFPQNFWPTVNLGIPAILNCFIFLYLSAAGAGPWSIDAVRMRGRFSA